MPRAYDILVSNASLREKPDQTNDIGIRDGKIVEVQPEIEDQASAKADAAGCLLAETLVNPQLHYCTVYTLQEFGDGSLEKYHGLGMGESMAAIEAVAKSIEKHSVASVLRDARRAIALSALNGVAHIRTFVDVDTNAGLIAVKAPTRAREESAGIVDL